LRCDDCVFSRVTNREQYFNLFASGYSKYFFSFCFIKPSNPAGTKTEFGCFQDEMFPGDADIYQVKVGLSDSPACCRQPLGIGYYHHQNRSPGGKQGSPEDSAESFPGKYFL
jgi:hypothetical protein